MIKIKDYIFNENNITEIHKLSNSLNVNKRNAISVLINDATFDDIEWNYGATQNATQDKIKEEYITLEKDYGTCELENDKLRKRIKELDKENTKLESENVDLHNENVDLKDKIKELEEENKTLKNLNVCVGCDNNHDYKSRIDEAIEYIEENKSVFGTNLDMNYLLRILKGEENE